MNATESNPGNRPPAFTQVSTFFVLDMLPRLLVAALAVILLGFVYGRIIAPPTLDVWSIIVTIVMSVALARVCTSLLLVTAASMVDGGPSSLTSEVSGQAATALASPHFARFYLTRLGIYMALGLALGSLSVLLGFITSAKGGYIQGFLIGPMVGVVYGHLATGWELAQRAAGVSHASSAR